MLRTALFLLLTAVLRAVSEDSFFDHDYRLPTHLTPIVYDLKLTFSSHAEEIKGALELQFQVENSTDSIELHADPRFITIKRASLVNKLEGRTIDLGFPRSDSHRQTVRFELAEALEEKNVYYLLLEYTTLYSFDHRGVVRKQDPVRGLWLNTLLETTNARRLLPSFDEPHWRSSFKLELRLLGDYAKEDMVALSCTEGQRTVENETSSVWTFVATPPIPTYLFTIAVGRFRSSCRTHPLVESEICIWRFAHWKDEEETIRLVVDTIARFQAYPPHLFVFNYRLQSEMADYLLADPATRLHFLIAPSKIKGMENFGLLNIREGLWPAAGDLISYQEFVKTLFHEMTHMWFGNLVTISHWSHIWLSESIVCYLSSVQPSLSEPGHDRTIEPLVSSRWAISIPSIAYTKGAAILRMLEAIVGKKQMRRLLRAYLRRHQFGHASTADFLHLLDAITDEEVRTFEVAGKEDILSVNETLPPTNSIRPSAFLNAWLRQGSHPIVFIAYDKSVHQFVFTQKPKLHTRSARSRRVQWPIPVWIDCAAGSVPERLFWLLPGRELVLRLSDLTLTNDSNAVAFNRNRSVYYEISFQY